MARSAEELLARLEEAEELLRAIRGGEVDALVVSGPHGDQIYTLSGADHPYRVMVEAMTDGAAILTADGTIFFSNRSLAAMLNAPLDEVIGATMVQFVLAGDLSAFETLIRKGIAGSSRGEIRLTAKGGSVVPAYLSIGSIGSSTARSACAVVTNLTEHKRNQELMAAQAYERARRTEAEAGRQRVATILESITDSFFAIDRTWRITDVNHRATAHFGRTRDELLGKAFWDVSVDGGDQEFRDLYRKAMRERIPVHCEVRSGIAEGRWLEEHIYPSDEGLAVYFRDITERKRGEQALRQANERVEMILSSITDRFFAFDSQWRFTYCNKHGEEQLRALGKDPAALIGKVTWEEIEADAGTEAAFRRAQSERIVMTHELFSPPLGEWVENRIYPSPDGGVAVFQRYITERKRAEAELRRSEALLAEGQRLSHTGSWVFNVHTGELFWSLEHFRIWGVHPDTFELTFEAARQLMHPEDRFAASHAFETVVSEGRSYERDFRVLRPDGTIRYVHSVGHPVFNEAGEPAEYVGTCLDITERREAEDERARLLRRVVQTQEDERRRIALEMHDQFGQQLSALVLKLSAHRRDQDVPPALAKKLTSLEAIARQLDADLESIVWRLRPTALDDLGLVAALTNYVHHWSEHFSVQTEWNARGIDRVQLTNELQTTIYRIMQEALNNVARHARARHVAVLLEGRPDRVSLIVEDNGLGFDVEQRLSSGHQFGLAGMRERAGLLGGTVDIESVPGKGTTVVARIPLPASREERAT
jgi:PAS domain S-box-containing protein